MNGIEIIEKLKRQRDELTALIVELGSSDVAEVVHDPADLEGGVSVLPKHFDIERLIKAWTRNAGKPKQVARIDAEGFNKKRPARNGNLARRWYKIKIGDSLMMRSRRCSTG